MSTDPGGRRAVRARRGRRRYLLTFSGVVAALGVLVVSGSAISLVQGPRISDVQVDPATAIETAGSRAILTANQALVEIDPSQVTVEPSTPFTVDAAGRGVGVRFTAPLDDDTEYRIAVEGAQSVGGGPVVTLETTFRTPPAQVLMLERSADGDDVIYRSGLTPDAEREIVFAAPEIDDFRAASGVIVVSVREEDGSASLLLVDESGDDAAPDTAVPFTLPGDGVVMNLQISERGGLVGYTYSDLPGATGDPGRMSLLYTASLRDPAAEPEPVEVAGTAPSVDTWQFIPDSTALLLIDFDSELVLVEPDADPGLLGPALQIDAIARGTYTAIVERLTEGIVWIDLESGAEEQIVEPDPSPGQLGKVLPLPTDEGEGPDGAAGVDTIRQYAELDELGVPQAQAVVFVDADGDAREVMHVATPDVLMQTCTSPSGQYVAATVAPDLVANPYDSMAQPMPGVLETRIVETATGDEVAVLDGFDISWCAVGPW